MILGANAIVSAGHALVGDIAEAQRNAALGSFALSTLSLFGFALMIGRLFSSFPLGVVRMNTIYC